MKDIFGLYNLRSRISVGVIFLAPLLIEGYIIIPEIRNFSTTLIVTIIAYSLSELIIVLSRKFGCKSLLKCFPNGLPAQQFLNPDNNYIDNISKQRYYKFLEDNIDGLNFSTNETNIQEQSESAINWLIAQTRDPTKFPLISEENMNLGFTYNLLGLKPFAICLNILLLITNMFFIISYYINLFVINFRLSIFCLITTVFFLLLWIFIINKSLVANCGKKYALALLSACDSPELNNK